METKSVNVGDWLRVFEGSALYRHDTGTLYSDWLELAVCCMANRTMEEQYLAVAKRYTRPELGTMARLLGMLVVIHGQHTAAGGWYDALGSIYEQLAGPSKASRLGQFFTPPAVCDVMARLTRGDGPTAPGFTVLDPACGSGRTLLSWHVLAKDHGPLYGADLDPICARMCALNFWLHGVRGEVACMDSLTRKWYFAFHIHARAGWPFITWLGEDRKHESHLYRDAAAPKPPAPDLFTVQEEEADYGEPFLPCAFCGQQKSTAVVLVGDEARELWTGEPEGPVCPQCYTPIWNQRTW